MNVEDQRLSRIELKLDKLSDAVVSLARMEERMLTLFKRMDSYDQKQIIVENRVREVEKVSISRGAIFRLVDKMVWLIVGLIIAIVAEMFINR